MPRNPFDDPLFWDVFLRVMLLIAAGFVGVALARRRPLRVLRRSTFFPRARTWLWIGPVFVVAVFTGGFVALLLALYVVVKGCAEVARIAGIGRRYALLLILFSAAGLLVAALAPDFFLFLPFGFLILLTLVPILSRELQDARRQVGDTLVAYLYVGLPMAYVVLARLAQPWGLNFLVIVAVSVAVSDVAAYAVGFAFKGPKVMPQVGPDKTWSGVLGNLVGAAVGVALLEVAIPPEWSVASVVVLVVMIAAGSAWGDVTESFIKRAFGARPTLVPGFRSVLERVDSLLMAFPLSYYALLLSDRLAG